MAAAVKHIPIIDTDTHVVEPPDLWTSRHLLASGATSSPTWPGIPPWQEEAWYSGDAAPRRRRGAGDGRVARAPAIPPASVRRHRPGIVGRTRRVAVMDEYGIQAQVLYPNVAVFDAKSILNMGDAELQLGCIQAYNDFLVDFGNEQPGPATSQSPRCRSGTWTLTLAEIERCADLGHKGIVFTQDPSYFGLPELTDRFWDPMWRSAEEKGMPVNFHIASGDLDPFNVGHRRQRTPRQLRRDGRLVLHGQRQDHRPADHRRDLPPVPRAQLRLGRERDRLDPLRPRRARLAVAELRRRQGAPRVRAAARASTSGARSTAASGSSATPRCSAIEQLGADNILYETDYPHPTSMSPGPASIAQRPDEYIRSTLSGLDEATLRKILHDNAARIYHLD